ncbi:MAG TPA: tellurite resistance/C4-dicarboxylate transporter family protein [Fimbriimonadaceae bacterium]|nr:tellurite resistance/C4-dicarboxylate transporter family protein [Fimbriimonadaceae bacterium]
MRKALSDAVGGLFPGYFALVMATGVVAIQANKLGYATPARVLVGVATLAYVVLAALTVARAIGYGPRLVADFRSFKLGAGFFTASAGTTVLGKSYILVLGMEPVALVLWALAWFVWGFLIYGFCLNLFTSRDKPPLQECVSGVWLIIPVATQSLSILTSILSPYLGDHSVMILTSLSLFMLGCAMYVLVIAAVIFRLVFFDLDPKDLRPAYWICMGAAAISTLAGVELCKRVDLWPLPFRPLPTLQGFSMFFWVLATAWIPMLVGLGIWRHATRKVPLSYEPQYWSMVFPLAMYAICTGGVADIFGLTALRPLSKAFWFIAFGAWCITFLGLIRNLATGLRAASQPVVTGATTVTGT